MPSGDTAPELQKPPGRQLISKRAAQLGRESTAG